MDTAEFASFTEGLACWLTSSPRNFVRAEDAIRPELAGLPLYTRPVFAVADAGDPMFAALKKPEVVGEGHYLPSDWLPGAATVLTCFLPFSDRVIAANAAEPVLPADEWLHGRIEGQEMLIAFAAHAADVLKEAGYAAVAPVDEGLTEFALRRMNWSERHVGFIAGLGSFGMSKSFIARDGAGIAGRLTSVVTTAPLPVTPRPSDDPYYLCKRCGKCAANCPVHAIDPSRPMHEAKDHVPCAAFCHDHAREFTLPSGGKKLRYGCGKCQVNVPCGRKI